MNTFQKKNLSLDFEYHGWVWKETPIEYLSRLAGQFSVSRYGDVVERIKLGIS
jgi:hypothetical protein